MVWHSQVKPEQANDGADQTFSLPQRQAEYQAHGQSGVDRRWCACDIRPEEARLRRSYLTVLRDRTEFGRPVANIRFKTSTPMAVSVC